MEREVSGNDSLQATWTNFRGYVRPTTIDFRRFTLLIGRNNVGKTSAYAPLLLLKQTLAASDQSTALLTRGDTIDVGTFSDVISNHDTSKTMKLAVRIPTRTELDHNRVVDAAGLELDFACDNDGLPLLMKHRVVNAEGKSIILRTRERVERGALFDVKSHLLPDRQAVGRPPREVTQLRAEMRNEQPDRFLFSGIRTLMIPSEWRRDADRWKKARIWFNAGFDMFNVYKDVNHSIVRRLEGISYLGPVRALPSRTYRYSAERPSDVGRDGEFAAEMLVRSATEEQVSIVNSWLSRLGYGQLEFTPLGEDFFQVHLLPDGRKGPAVNLAHAGVGLSQLLPILVQGATASEEATLISQQPEIHLNPAQQVQMTDFLIDVLDSNQRRVVLETHSEHVLLRLRRRIAEGRIDSQDVAIYYCDSLDGRSRLERIEMGQFGEIVRSDWPTGFFDEQLTDSFALAKAQQAPR